MAVHVGLEHHGEVGGVGDSEADIGHADLQEAAGALPGCGGVIGQQLIALGGHGGQQSGLVAEMVGRGGMGYPGSPGQLAEAQAGRSVFGDRLERGTDQGGTQAAMVVRPTGRGCGLRVLHPGSLWEQSCH